MFRSCEPGHLGGSLFAFPDLRQQNLAHLRRAQSIPFYFSRSLPESTLIDRFPICLQRRRFRIVERGDKRPKQPGLGCASLFQGDAQIASHAGFHGVSGIVRHMQVLIAEGRSLTGNAVGRAMRSCVAPDGRQGATASPPPPRRARSAR